MVRIDRQNLRTITKKYVYKYIYLNIVYHLRWHGANPVSDAVPGAHGIRWPTV